MVRQFLVATAALALSASSGLAQTTVEKTRIERTRIDGKVMFDSYCAVCHGKAGKGDGPAAPAMKSKPTDLTTISTRNGGTFPAVKVRRCIEGADEVAAHGSRDMPIWGDLFKSLDQDMVEIRLSALLEHVKTMQTK